MSATVVGLFDNRDTADAAVRDLIAAGFNESQVSVVVSDPDGTLRREHSRSEGTLAGEGAATGLTSGAVIGGLLGLLIGAGAILVPIGIIAAGPIAGLIVGGAAGAAAGGVLGGLIGLGIPEPDADIYAESIRRGGTLVVVEAEAGRIDEAHAVLNRDGAVDIEDRAEAYRREGFERYDPDAPVYKESDVLHERTSRTPEYDAATANRIRAYEGRPIGVTRAYADNPPIDSGAGIKSTEGGIENPPGDTLV